MPQQHAFNKISAPAQQEALEKYLLDCVEKGDAVAVADFLRDHSGAVRWPMTDENNQGLEQSALHVAARLGHVDVAKALLAAGAAIDAQDGGRCTPLMHAADHGRTDMIEYLLTQEPDVNARDRTGGTPLCCAAQAGSVEAARLLLDAGAAVDGDKRGDPPLFYAMYQDDEQVVCGMIRLLLDRGADATRRDHSRCTAAEFARKGGSDNIANYIEDYAEQMETERELQAYMSAQHELDLLKSGTEAPMTVGRPLKLRQPRK